MGLYTVERREAEVSVTDYLREFVDVPKFLGFCQECENFGRRWACPPFDFDPMDVWKKYRTLHIAAKIITPGGNAAQGEMKNVLLAEKSAFFEELLSLEGTNPGSLALSAGTCDLCEDCTRPQGGPCRYPEKLRWSLEALGGDVCKTAEIMLKTPLLWEQNGRLPAYYTLVGGLLV